MGSDFYSRVPELHMIRNGALTGMRHRDGFLHPVARPFAGAMITKFVLMDDNQALQSEHRESVP